MIKKKGNQAKKIIKEAREFTGSIQRVPSLQGGISTPTMSATKLRKFVKTTEGPATDPRRISLNLTTSSIRGSWKQSKDSADCRVPEKIFESKTPRYPRKDSLHFLQCDFEDETVKKFRSKMARNDSSPYGICGTFGLQTESSTALVKDSSLILSQPPLERKFSQLTEKNKTASPQSPNIKRREQHSEVKVVARVRPLSHAECAVMEKGMGSIAVEIVDSRTLHFTPEIHDFTLDSVFGPEDTQIKIYNTVGLPTILDILEGYNGTIFAYGPTGSGKTYTMFGPEINDQELKGIIPRAAFDVFSLWNNQTESIELEVRCSMVELYKEHLKDLLADCDADLRIKESPSRGIYVEGLRDFPCSNEEELMFYIQTGSERRHWAETRQNAVSSRSHSIFIVEVIQKMVDGSEKRGILNLVDLAGSEKVGRSGAQGIQFEEGTKINLSLSALGNVIHALTSNVEHIPYRDSKLTRLLQESLGGNFKTTLITTCSPHSSQIGDSLSTLQFAARAKRLRNKVKANIKLSAGQLQKIIDNLKKELIVKETQIETMKKLLPKTESSGDLSAIQTALNSGKLGVIDDFSEIIIPYPRVMRLIVKNFVNFLSTQKERKGLSF